MSKQKSDNPEWQKELQDAYTSVSDETTGADLDASILQMAEQHHTEEKVVKTGFWNNLFRSNFVKYGVSASFALLMTVGIARLMVHLGKTDQNAHQEVGIASADVDSGVEFDSGSKSDISHNARSRSADAHIIDVHNNVELAAPELQKKVKAQKNAEYYQEMVAAEKKRVRRPVAAIELNDEAESLIADSQSVLARANTKAPKAKIKDQKRATELAEDHDAGILDEAVLGYPLPEIWLEEIEELLLQKDELKTLESWQQFKNTYPDYQVPSNILEQIERLQSIGQKLDTEQG